MNEDMPRERIIKYGVDNLNDYELLAIMLGSGTKTEDVITLSKRLTTEYGLNKLLKMDYNELKNIKGIGVAKATKLMASFELARRAERKTMSKAITGSKDLYEYLKSYYMYKEVEEVIIVYTDVKCRVVDMVKASNQASTFSRIPTREIISKALSNNCYGVFLAHNHPSGDVNPSKDDILTTKIIARVLRDVNIALLDHIIISKDKYYSFSDNNIL